MQNKVILDIEQEQELLISLAYQIENHKSYMEENKSGESSEISEKIDNVEELRLKLIQKWLNVPKAEAVNMRLTSIDRGLAREELSAVRNIGSHINEFKSILNQNNRLI